MAIRGQEIVSLIKRQIEEFGGDLTLVDVGTTNRTYLRDYEQAITDGTAALLAGPVDPARLPELPGVEGWTSVAPDCTLVWGAPGQQFGIDWGLKGHHGSPRTATQLAIVGGGHPAVPNLARQLAQRAPAASSWAGLIGQLLEL